MKDTILKEKIMFFLNSISYCELKTNKKIIGIIHDLLDSLEIIPSRKIEYYRKKMIPYLDEVIFFNKSTKI